MNVQNQQKGFTVLEIALVTIVITGLVGVGGYTYTRINDNNKEKSSSVDTQSKAKSKISQSQGYVYEPADKAYKIALPDGWKFIYTPATSENGNISYLYAPVASMESAVGVKASVKNQAGGYGPGAGFTLESHALSNSVGYAEGMKSLGSFDTKEGVKVYKFQDESAVEPFGGMDGQEGSSSSTNEYLHYEYFVADSKDTLFKFTYSRIASDPDATKLVEDTIRTLQIL